MKGLSRWDRKTWALASPCFSIGAQCAAECGLVAERAGVEKFKQRPHLAEIVLDRGAGQHAAESRIAQET
jgi:hypothetical protein